MSNYLAIAAVTATLQNVLGSAAAVVSGAKVTTDRPDNPASSPRPVSINVYLFQVTPNGASRNLDLPTRTGNGDLLQRSQAALDLHYLISFYGDENKFEPQRLLGSTVRRLHDQPVLSRQAIATTVSTAPFSTFPDISDLASAPESVRFTPAPISLEEMSKLWSYFFQIPYALSIVYQASVVFIEGTGTPAPAPPVLKRKVYALPFRNPQIERVLSSLGDQAPIVAGSTIVIEGEQLQGEITTVLLGGVERTPLTVSSTRITLTLPSDVKAGVQGLQVVQKTMLGEPATAHRGVQSNVAAFVYVPSILTSTATASLVTVNVSPTLRAGQRVALLLNEVPALGSHAYAFSIPALAADTASVQVPISGVHASTYLVRIQVDGAESPLTTDSGGVFNGPTVVVP